MKQFQDGLDFKDVALIPNVISTIKSRSEIKIESKLGSANLSIPIISSPMKDVSDGNVTEKICKYGAYGIIHRFWSVEEQVKNYKQGAAAIGVNGDFLKRFEALYSIGCKTYCIDVANGGNINVEIAIKKILQLKTDVEFIVGNVASSVCYDWCQSLPNVVGIRIFISPGEACTTSVATGIYSPHISTIMECATVKKPHVSMIADGGIKDPRDFCKAIIFGCDAIMMGGAISQTTDSPAELIMKDEKYYKLFHGSASYEVQRIYKNPKYVEGRARMLPYNDETLGNLLSRFMDGLVSSMSYFNARTIQEYQKNLNWVRI